jgi:hypothetical protein
VTLKSANAAWWAAAVILLLAFLYALNLTMYNLWASGGPPVPDPEIYRHRANVSFGFSCGFLLGLVAVIWKLVGRFKDHSDSN